MGKSICVTNQKGGVGKTTTVINLATSLAATHKKTLIIDMDPQANATSGLGLNKDEISPSIYDVLIGQSTFENSIMGVYTAELNDCLYICPSSVDLTGAEIELINTNDREWVLKKSVETIINDFEYILIDCPPSLNLLTVNALTASDSVIIPVQCEYYALEGLSQLNRTINLIRNRLNAHISIEGYLLTLFDTRNRLSHLIVNEVKNYFNSLVFETIIPRNVKLAECPSHGKPILLYDAGSSGSASYVSLANEMLNRNSGDNSLEK